MKFKLHTSCVTALDTYVTSAELSELRIKWAIFFISAFTVATLGALAMLGLL